MQKGVDAVAIGVIALGVVILIVLFVLSNNMMPDPLPAVQKPDLNATERMIRDPLSASSAPAGGQMGGGFGGTTGGPMGFSGSPAPGGSGGGLPAPSGPPPGIGGGRRGAMGGEDY